MLEFKGYLEEIESFTFRETGFIQIPKSIREKAFSYRLDIEIVSIARENYRNFKTVPAHSFYGYAVLVMRDHCEIKIPIEQARQTIYFEKIVEAYVNWYNLCFWLNQREYSKGVAVVLGQIGNALGLGSAVVPPAPCPVWSGFEEIQLREVYIKCPFGTQFKLESSYWSPVIQNGDTDCSYDGKSGQSDGGKDNGLPPATAPQQARNPSNPYNGFPPASTPEQLGEFSNNRNEESLNSPNPDNESTEDYVYYWLVTWTTTSSLTSCVPVAVELNFVAPETSNFEILNVGAIAGICPTGREETWRIKDANGVTLFQRLSYALSGVGGGLLFGKPKHPNGVAVVVG